jgi:hypothetical protein
MFSALCFKDNEVKNDELCVPLEMVQRRTAVVLGTQERTERNIKREDEKRNRYLNFPSHN